jgi:CO dehydrogenase maturation factor
MKIAFAGKGGSGKTTLSSLFTRHLAALGRPVVTIDAGINQHLGEALGATTDPPPMGAYLPQIKEYLRGSNPRITSAAAMVKTTPPGRGSRLLRPGGPDPVHDLAVTTPCGAQLLATGPFGEEDLGVACYHSKTGAVEMYLNHLADGPGEYVVVDCTAGADSFASGLFTRFDLSVLVAEPTRKGLGVYRQWQEYTAGVDVAVVLAGNKVQGDEDVAFLRRHAGDDLLTWFGHEPRCGPWSRAARPAWPISARRPGPRSRSCKTRWTPGPGTGTGTRQAAEFHLKNARTWASAAVGQDLTGQIDPGFTLDPRTSQHHFLATGQRC